MSKRSTVIVASVAAVAIGLVAAGVRFATAGGGGYGDAFAILGFVAILLVISATAAIVRFAREHSGSLQPLALSVLAMLVLFVLALAIGLRG